MPPTKWFIALLCILVATIGCSRKPQEPEDSPGRNLYNFRMDGALFSRDEKRVLFTGELAGVLNVFIFNIETGASTPLTKAKTPAYPLSFALDDRNVLCRSSPQGESAEHLFRVEAGGAVTDLTPWRGVQSVFYSWATDRRSFYFGSNKDDRRFLYVYRMDITDKSYSTVLQTQDMRFAASSRTGRELALWKYISADKSELYLYDFETKTLDKVAPEKGNAVSVPQFFDAGQDLLYYLTNEGSRVLSLVKYDVQKKVRSPAYTAGQQIAFARQSSNQRYFVVGVRQGDRLISRLFDIAGSSWIEVPINQPSLILDISPSGRYMLYTTGGDASARDLQLYNLETREVRKILPS